jgi:hypothetical protein
MSPTQSSFELSAVACNQMNKRSFNVCKIRCSGITYQLADRAFCVLCIRMLLHFLCTTHNEDDRDRISPVSQDELKSNY